MLVAPRIVNDVSYYEDGFVITSYIVLYNQL